MVKKKFSMICTGMRGMIYHVSKFLITHIDEINSRRQIKKSVFNMSIGYSFLSAARGLKPIARITCGFMHKDSVAKVGCRACGLQTSRNDLPLAREE